jgi:gliding motility-associated lipoprotein GldH
MKKLYYIIFVLLVVFSSCADANSYHKMYSDFPDNRWDPTTKKDFDFTIADAESYDLILEFSHVYDYQFDSVPIVIAITNPDGSNQNVPIDLQIKDASGEQLADCVGDVCDLNTPIKSGIKLAKGNYHLSISQTFEGPYLPNVLGVGLHVKHSK